jgi:hypothetical protein
MSRATRMRVVSDGGSAAVVVVTGAAVVVVVELVVVVGRGAVVVGATVAFDDFEPSLRANPATATAATATTQTPTTSASRARGPIRARPGLIPPNLPSGRERIAGGRGSGDPGREHGQPLVVRANRVIEDAGAGDEGQVGQAVGRMFGLVPGDRTGSVHAGEDRPVGRLRE